MIVYVCICLYVPYMYMYLWKHTGMIKHYTAMHHVPLDSDCSRVCLSFVIKSLLYSFYLALGAITEIPHTAFLDFVGGYFVVG